MQIKKEHSSPMVVGPVETKVAYQQPIIQTAHHHFTDIAQEDIPSRSLKCCSEYGISRIPLVDDSPLDLIPLASDRDDVHRVGQRDGANDNPMSGHFLAC